MTRLTALLSLLLLLPAAPAAAEEPSDSAPAAGDAESASDEEGTGADEPELPGAEEPAAAGESASTEDALTAEEPVTEEPVTEEPVTDEPVTDEPAQEGQPVPGEDDDDDEEDETALIEDLVAPFFFLGGGGGVVLSNLPDKPIAAGRVAVGAGFYLPMLYVSGGLDYSPTPFMPLMFDGWVALGAAIPVPVFHPFIGFKFGGGVHWSTHGWGSQLVYGPQIGWIVRGYGKKVGLRAMVEPAVRWYPETSFAAPEILLTLSLVL